VKGAHREALVVVQGRQRALALELGEILARYRCLHCLIATLDLAAVKVQRCAEVRLLRVEELGQLLCAVCRWSLGLRRGRHHYRGFVSRGAGVVWVRLKASWDLAVLMGNVVMFWPR
jgi:hypothetical protein